MALPQMTDEQRAKALKKAKETRRKRAEVREKIKLGKLTAKKVLAKRSDPIYGKIKVSQFIQSFPGYGKAKAAKIMEEIGKLRERNSRKIDVTDRAAQDGDITVIGVIKSH